jgi:pimeloyl-ACP methyl ester carboxylesterase
MAQVETIAARVAGPCELVKIPECGHRLHRDQHDLTLDAIARFVARIAP